VGPLAASSWLGRYSGSVPALATGADWLFAGDREFVIEEQPDETVLFSHVEDVHGALFPIFRAFMGGAIQRSHDAFNAALKGPGSASA